MTSSIRISMLLLAIFVALTATDVAAQNSGGGRLAGTWDATVKIYVCATGAEIVRFKSVGSFHQGGTFSGITAGMPPAARSPELGVWKHEKENTYTLQFKAFQFNPATGLPTVYQVVTHTVELDADNLNYVSDGGVKFYDMDGNQTGAGCSSTVATRMVP